MKVLVTGGTGFLGQELVYQLILNGHEVTVLTRQSAESMQPCPYQVLQWPTQSPDELRRLIDHDAVINLSGESIAGARWSDSQKEKIRGSRIRFTDELYASFRSSTRLKHFISASAIGIYGDRKTEVLTEESIAGEGFLADVCKDWEKSAQQFAKLDVRVAFLRTGVVLGRNQGFLAQMEPLFHMWIGGPIGGGEQQLSWIHLQDWVSATIHVLENANIQGPVNLVAPEPVSNSAFTEIYGKMFRQPFAPPAPKFAVQAAMGEMSSIALDSQNVRPQVLQKTGFKFKFPYLKEALDHLYEYESQEFQVFDCFQASQWVPQPLSDVFPFFSDAKNLERLTPEFLNFKVLNQSTKEIGEGTLINYRLKIHGVPASWQTRIDKWNPPHTFVDTQLKGPYQRWHHTHTFQPLGNGTLLRDRVHYKLPMGGLGRLFGGWLVKKDVQNIFAYRRKVIRELFG